MKRTEAEPTKKKLVYIEDYLKMVKDPDNREFKLFERIFPFFNGGFNHHEIQLITGCSRGSLDKIVSLYGIVLEKFWLP